MNALPISKKAVFSPKAHHTIVIKMTGSCCTFIGMEFLLRRLGYHPVGLQSMCASGGFLYDCTWEGLQRPTDDCVFTELGFLLADDMLEVKYFWSRELNTDEIK